MSGYSFTTRAITAYTAPEAPREPIDVAPMRNLNKQDRYEENKPAERQKAQNCSQPSFSYKTGNEEQIHKQVDQMKREQSYCMQNAKTVDEKMSITR